AGSDSTLVTFSGPAGSFTIAPNNATDTLLQVFVPTQVFSTAGTNSVTVYAYDTGVQSPRTIGPASLSIINRAASTSPIVALPEVVTAEATSASGAIVTFTVAATNPDGSYAAVSCDHASSSLVPLDTTVVTCS